MGLSASQAKLLSITSRISSNELRAQQVTRQKTELANQTIEANQKYLDALNNNNLTYKTYDLDGNQIYKELTGSVLTSYAPLKNQYGLINTYGQILVSETDGANYKNSNNMYEFLEKYGVEVKDTGEVISVTNPEYTAAFEIYDKKHQQWLTEKPDMENEKYWTRDITSDDSLYKIFESASKSCFNNATGTQKRQECYLHVLAHMLDLDTTFATYPKSLTTSTGKSISISKSQITGSAIYYSNQTENMQSVSDAVRDGWNGSTVLAAENPEDTLQATSNESEKLLSNYYYDTNGEKQLKTLRQKCIDLYYAVENHEALGIDYDTTLVDAIKSFQNDMISVLTEEKFDDELYNADIKEWQEKEPKMDENIAETIETKVYEYSDSNEAQWYVNLWHRMNGESEDKDGIVPDAVGKDTNIVGTRWDILEDGLMNSSKWLQNSLERGSITLEKVNFAEVTKAGTGLYKAEWQAIISSSVLEIAEEGNEQARAKAEAEFESVQKSLESKDKQFDNILKLLDTEHSALSAEYDSVKSVIQKNIDRTLKMYSA